MVFVARESGCAFWFNFAVISELQASWVFGPSLIVKSGIGVAFCSHLPVASSVHHSKSVSCCRLFPAYGPALEFQFQGAGPFLTPKCPRRCEVARREQERSCCHVHASMIWKNNSVLQDDSTSNVISTLKKARNVAMYVILWRDSVVSVRMEAELKSKDSSVSTPSS